MLPNLTIRQLQTFREVMRSGSMSQAARTMQRTQPAVSAMISGIEQDLGLALFVRERGRLIPRPEAHYFLEEAEEVLERLDRAARSMSEIRMMERGRLRIACHPAASTSFVPDILSEFLRSRPEVKVDLMMRSSDVVSDLIASQAYDIGIADTLPDRGAIQSEKFDLECVIALQARDPLQDREHVTPQDLDGHPLAALFDEHVTSCALRDAFQSQNAIFNQRFVLRTFFPALRLVRSGLCAALVDLVTATSAQTDGVIFRPFRPAIISSVSILTPAHRPSSLLTVAFRDIIRNRFRKLSQS